MTGFTHFTAVNMGSTFACGDSTIMASDASVSNRTVINTCTQPGGGDMTNIATGCGNDMRRPFANSNHTIMTRLACTRYLIMIH